MARSTILPTSPRRNRKLFFEAFEQRLCLSFSATCYAGTITFTGTSGNDTLLGFTVNPFNEFRWVTDSVFGGFTTAPALTGCQYNTTPWPPTAQFPLKVIINGLGGNDLVDLAKKSGLGNASQNVGVMTPLSGNIRSIFFHGGSGNDVFYSPFSGDVQRIEGSSIPSIIFEGASGQDKLYGDSDPETFIGGDGNDIAFGSGGNDKLYGGDYPVAGVISPPRGADNDQLHGEDGRDFIVGGFGNDFLFGGDGNDVIYAGPDNDTVNGDQGDDRIFGDEGSDILHGGEHDDEIYTGSSGSIPASPATAPGGPFFELVYGNEGWDLIDANEATGRLYIDGGDGPDTIYGSESADEIHGGTSIDWLSGNYGNDEIVGGQGADFLWGGAGDDQIVGGIGHDDIEGDDESDTISGGDGNDWISSGGEAAIFGGIDQPWNPGDEPHPTWTPMANAGGPGCDDVDDHSDDPSGTCDRPPRLFDQQTSVPRNTNSIAPAAPGGVWLNYTFVLDSGPTYASGVNFVFNADGSFRYFIPRGLVGIDQFTYHAVAKDGTFTTDTATFTIKVGDWDAAPEDRRFELPQGAQQLNVPAPGVLQNITEPSTAHLLGDSGAGNGTVTVNEDGSFTYAPNEGFIGTDFFLVIAHNTSTNEDSEPLRIDIEVPDYTTRANEDSYRIAPGGNLTDTAAGLLFNDQWADTVAAVYDTAAHGGVSFNESTGSFSYTPDAGYSGPDEFGYSAMDFVTGELKLGIIKVDVSALVAADDEYNLPNSDSPLSGNVRDNDVSFADLITLLEDDGPAYGQLTLNGNGTFEYTPPSGFVGDDFFSYIATDTATGNTSLPISVVIHVGPRAKPDHYAVATNDSITWGVNVLNNDGWGNVIEPLGDLPPGLTLNVVDGFYDGTFEYIPPTGFSGAVSFEYFAKDTNTNEGSNATLVVIDVIQPVAAHDSYSTLKNTELRIPKSGLMTNDTYADVAEYYSTPSHGYINVYADGSFAYTPQPNYTGPDSFQYRVRNNATNTWSTPGTVNINVIAPAAVPNSYTAYRYGVLNVSAPGVLANDQHANSAFLVSPPNPAHGTLTFNADGSFQFVPTTTYEGPATFTYKIYNAATNSWSDPATVTIQVNGPPIAGPAESYTFRTDVVFDAPAPGLLGNDEKALTAGFVTSPAHAALFDLNYSGQGRFRYIAQSGYTGSDSFQYHAGNPAGYSETVTVTLNIHGYPTAAPDTYTMSPGGTLNVTGQGVRTNDNVNNPWTAGVQLVPNTGPYHHNGAFTLNTDGTFTYQPVAGYEGTDTFQYHAIDPSGNLYGMILVTIQVFGPPPVGAADTYNVSVAPYTWFNSPHSVITNDQYATAAEFVTAPQHGNWWALADGTFGYNPGAYLGTDSFQYRAVKVATGQRSDPVTVTLNVTALTPTANSDEFNTALGFSVAGCVLCNDDYFSAYGEPTTEAVETLPPGLVFEGANFEYTPPAGTSGTVTFQYKFTQPGGITSTTTTVTMNVLPLLPIGYANYLTIGPQGDISAADLIADDVWASSASIGSQPENGSVTFDGTNFHYTANSGYEGYDWFTYLALNSSGQSDPVLVHLDVFGPGSIAQPDEYWVQEGEYQVCGNVRDNDSLADSVTMVGSNQYVTLNSDGSFCYENSGGIYGDDWFQYVATHSGSGTQSIPIDVNIRVDYGSGGSGVNGDEYWGEGSAGGCVLDNDQNAFSASLESSTSNGSLSFGSSGCFSYSAYEGFEGDDFFSYRAFDAQGNDIGSAGVIIHITPYNPQTLARPEINSTEPQLVLAQLLLIRDEAIRRWRAAGLLDNAIEAQINTLQFRITDLPGSHIGASTKNGKILIDKNAAGYGWFVDTTPQDDSEFEHRTESELLALNGLDAVTHADLLTVVMHEMGNQLGLTDLTDASSGRLLTWVLDLGVRRTPVSQDALLANFLFLYPTYRRRVS